MSQAYPIPDPAEIIEAATDDTKGSTGGFDARFEPIKVLV
jgi:hypothetical protein